MQQVTIPYRKQENVDYYCGPAVVQMILLAYGQKRSQTELAKILGTDETGTDAGAIKNFLSSLGFIVERKNGAVLADIEHALAQGASVIVGYIEPDENELDHYGIVADLTQDHIVLIDPLLGPALSMTRQDFESRWRDDPDNKYGERMMMSVSHPE